ncbi:MAG TPA: C13 family peptidase [Allosphingosinicella sp.]|jgi:hypothetical protein
MGGKRLFAALALALAGSGAGSQAYQPPRHSVGASPLLAGGSELEILFRADAGTQIEQHRSPKAELEEHRKLDRALKALAPQRAGVLDAYVVSIALDSDPVFGREAREAGAVLQRRYGAAGRTIVLAGSDGSGPSALPRGSPTSLAVALSRVVELMDEQEDVLILYTTSHGAKFGLYYHDGDSGFGAISPTRLGIVLDELGITNRLLIISACYSGIFVPALQSDTTAIVTAAAADRTSFGCAAENDWTFFGDAFVNRALRKPQSLGSAFAEAGGLVSGWEAQAGAQPSHPQFHVGPGAARWLEKLEQRMPKVASQPVGRPALSGLQLPGRH